MTDKIMTYYSLQGPDGQKQHFATERKLRKWGLKNSIPGETPVSQHEIPVSVAKELIKLSKKKLKEKCPECGK